MGFKSAADGLVSKGKTDVKVFGNSGPTVSVQKGGKGGAGGKTNEEMMKLGRNEAKLANQKRG